MENKKIAILGLIHVCADEAMGYMDDGGDSYKLFRLRQELGLEIVAEYPRIQYQNRVQFVWTMFRLGPTCTFFDNPEEVTELDLGELQMIYMSQRLIVGWLKCFVIPEELKLERLLN
jgi:hypothetical protein